MVKKLCDNLSRVKFSFSGPSTKIYHRVHRENLSCTKTRWTSTEELQLSPVMYYKGKSTSCVGKTVLRLQVSQTEEPSHVKQPASCAT